MPINNPHELSVVQLHTSAMGAAVNIGGLEDLQAGPATEVRGGATSGTLYSEHESVASQRPEITFTSVSSIKTLLDNVGLLGKALSAGANVGLAGYLVKRSKGGSYATGAAHRRYRMADGIIVPTSLRATFGDDVRLSYRAVGCYDGSNPPLQEQDSQTIPTSPAPVRNERFSLYSVSFGGVTLSEATGVEIDFGQQLIVSTGATGNIDELVWPTHVSINAIVPTITISGIDPLWVKSTAIPMKGATGTHANTSIKLARRKHGSTFYGTSESEHIKITTAGLCSVDTVISASDKDNGTVSLQIRSIFDGTNVPLVITTATTL